MARHLLRRFLLTLRRFGSYSLWFSSEAVVVQNDW
jgi:hypothetical protein